MEKITIEKFMAVQKMEIEVKPFSLLLGEQASGKSTVSKLIYFFKSIRQELLIAIYQYIQNNPTKKDLWTIFHTIAFEKFYNIFGSTRQHPQIFEVIYQYPANTHIALSLDRKKNLIIHVSFFDSLFLFKSVEFKGIIQEIRNASASTTPQENVTLQRANQALEKFIDELLGSEPSALFIPDSRSITVKYPESFRLDLFGNLLSTRNRPENGDLSIPSFDLHLITTFVRHVVSLGEKFRIGGFEEMIADYQARHTIDEEALGLAMGVLPKILKGEYRYDTQGEKVYFNDLQFVFLNNASSGQQESVRILQDLFWLLLEKHQAFRVIEEPESHLYPMAQKHLLELLVLLVNRTQSQIFLTTHSPYVLSVVNNLLYAQRVAGTQPKSQARVEAIIPKAYWLNTEQCAVYYLENGRSRSLLDRQTGLIDQNALDDISQQLSSDFNQLYELQARG